MPQFGQFRGQGVTHNGRKGPLSGHAVIGGQEHPMDAQHDSSPPARSRRPSGRDAKIAARTARSAAFVPYITRKIPYYEVLGRGGAGAARAQRRHDSRGDRHRFPRRSGGARALEGRRRRRAGRARALPARPVPHAWCRRSAPQEFTQYARNPARNVVIGGNRTVFAPAYGSPFVRNLDEGRRYATHRGLPQFREARLHGDLAAPLRRHDLRAGRPAGQQAALRHGVQRT